MRRITELGLFTAFVCLGITAQARAELPPDVYDKKQREAPEALTIEVLSVKTVAKPQRDITFVDVAIEARVSKVQRSRSEVKEGSVIKISYVHVKRKTPKDGPSQVPILEKGKTYPAYLQKQGDRYEPAAGGHTFEHALLIEYRKTGGFANVKLSGRIDSGDLSDEQMARLRELLIKADFFRRDSDSKPSNVADDFRYEIRVQYGHVLNHTVAVWGHTPQAEMLPLLRFLNERIAKRP